MSKEVLYFLSMSRIYFVKYILSNSVRYGTYKIIPHEKMTLPLPEKKGKFRLEIGPQYPLIVVKSL